VTPGSGLLLAGAGLLAGALNTAAGGGSLLTFPALLATGLGGLSANVTNTVGLVPGYVGGVLGYRRELAGQGPRVRALAVDALVGGTTGVALLLLTPASAFDSVVPALIAGACLLLLAQPRIGAAVRRRRPQQLTRVSLALHAAVLLGSVYGAYFGAGLGVVLLAVLGIALGDDLQRVNALKGTVTLTVNVTAAAGFAVFAPVDVPAALVIAVSSVGGGFAGAAIARRIPPTVLRVGVSAAGLAVAAHLAW